jgi:hypothetical protein
VKDFEDCVSQAGMTCDFHKNTRHFGADLLLNLIPVERAVWLLDGRADLLHLPFSSIFQAGISTIPAVPFTLAGGIGADLLAISGAGLGGEPPPADGASTLPHEHLPGRRARGVDYFR